MRAGVAAAAAAAAVAAAVDGRKEQELRLALEQQ